MMMSMRSMKTILACACAVLAVSCAEKNEIAKPAPETRTITLNATSETIASQDKIRTALDKDGLSVVWKKGDLIQLWYLKNDGSYAKAGELAALSQGNALRSPANALSPTKRKHPIISQFHAIAPMAPKYSTR